MASVWPERTIAGVIFDCDGTIADTERLTAIAFEQVLARYGYAFTSVDFRAIVGRSFEQNWSYFAQRAPVGELAPFKAEWYEVSFGLLDTDLRLFPDAVTSLREIHDHGLPIAVASSSPRAHVLQVLDHEGLNPLVDAIVGSEDVTEHKPDPAPYLEASRRLAVDARACVAVEDTPVGITAARGAGMYTVAVRRDGFSRDALSHADLVVEWLSSEILMSRLG